MNEKTTAQAVPKDEEIGYHKGAIFTLINERNELLRISSVVEQLLRVHLKALKDLGIDLEAEMKKTQQSKKLEEKIS